MSLPKSYLTSYKNVSAMVAAVQEAQAPDRFTVKFLQELGFTSAADRLLIRILKFLGLLTDSGAPTEAYHEFLDPSLSGAVIAKGIRSAYSDLFQINRNAHNMSQVDVRAKFKTISKGAHSDEVLGKMSKTFAALVKHGDFDAKDESLVSSATNSHSGDSNDDSDEASTSTGEAPTQPTGERSTGFVYNINIHLPATRDPLVYDSLFISLKKHLGI